MYIHAKTGVPNLGYMYPGVHRGVCLAVMTDPFALQVLSITTDKISHAVTAGL